MTMRQESDSHLNGRAISVHVIVSFGSRPISFEQLRRIGCLRVLLIEDDCGLGPAVRDQIAADGHTVDWARKLDEAADYVRTVPYDLILLDLMLPDGRGIEFLRARRVAGDVTPVIILTALDQISDRIAGLNAGADDYLVKPFDLSELSARLNAVARRYSGNPNPLIIIGDLEIDLAARSYPARGAPGGGHGARMGAARSIRATAGDAVVQVTARRQAVLCRIPRSRAMRSRSMSAGCARNSGTA